MTARAGTIAAALAALAAAGGGARAAAPQDSAFFRVPAAPDAAVRADNVREFAADRDWLRTVEELQVLLDQHDDSVLPERFHDGALSMYTLHPGASTWALATLRGLPREAREEYRERFADTAAAALANARDALDQRALAEVARRYPLTPAAAEALVAMGDLEAARGDGAAALAAWRRAREVEADAGAALGGLEARLGHAADLHPEERAGGYLRLPGRDAGLGPVPQAGGDRWVVDDVSLEPFDRMRGAESYSLFPVLAGGRLLVSTTFALYCFDAYSSELLWEAGPPEGWDDLRGSTRRNLTNRINRRKLLVAPAAGESVAVAALQVPTRHSDEHEYQGIDITGPIPERRLFAYDLRTGAPLWDHRPPADWDGEGGTFAQRMMVAAPPVVAGTRVLVPCYRMRGRIDFHVACYDLLTGERLWSTGLISGQDDLNMFGRHEEEFCAAPVVVDGDEVYVLTQLGALARLDLFTGRIVWESRYEVIPIPKNDGWHETKRRVYWRNAPPALTADVLVATPLDSELLLGADRETGAILWSYDHDDLDVAPSTNDEEVRAPHPYDVLLGADEDTVYVGGPVTSALRKPGGLGYETAAGSGLSREPFRARWSYLVPGHNLPRGVLGRDALVVHSADLRAVVDRRTGRELEARSEPVDGADMGNVALGDGVLITLGNNKVTATFDWEVLLARAEAALEEDPDGVAPRVDHAALLLRRARSHAEDAELAPARKKLARARASLEELLARTPDARVERKLFEVLTEEARVHRLGADRHAAVASLSAALELAATPVEVRDTLLAQEALFRSSDDERWRAVVGRLLAECAELPLPSERLEQGLGWLVGESLFELAPADLRGAEVPVGVWALFARADARARSHDYAAAHADLHAAIERFGSVPLAFDLDVRDVAAARIARRVELDGRAPLAEQEAEAQALLERADAARDPELLAEVERLYPHARAARRADELRLELALAGGDAATAARIAFDRLGRDPVTDAEDAAVAMRLADLFAREGNEAYEAALLRRLARAVPGAASPLERHGGKTYAELERALDAAGPTVAPTATFGTSLTRTAARRGDHTQIGVLLTPSGDGESAPEVLRILIDRRTVVAYSSRAPSREAWSHELELSGTPRVRDDEVAFSPAAGGRVVAATRQRVVALDARDGDLAWSAEIPDAVVDGVAVGSGLALVRTAAVDPAAGAEVFDLHAFELGGGVPLWRLRLGGNLRWIGPAVHRGLAVVLAPLWSLPSTARVVDATRGRVLRDLDLGAAVPDDSWDAAWMEDGRLIVPFFSTWREDGDRRVSRVVAYDLERGREVWALPFDPATDLRTVAAHDGRSFLITRGNTTGSAAGAILELDVRSGQARRVADLRADEDVIGLERRARNPLPHPALFTYTLRKGARTVPARLIPLDRGPGWVYQLQVSEESIYAGGFPYPAVSDRLVAFVYPTRNADSFAREDARMELVDRRGGFHRGTLTLSPDISRSASFELHGLGDAILVQGSGARRGGKSSSQLEVLETAR